MIFSKKELKKKLVEENREGKKFQSLGHGNGFRLMIDTSDGEIWSDCLTQNETRRYRSDTIVQLDDVDLLEPQDDETDTVLRDAIRLLKKAGHDITD